jgi:flavin reductase (DIM6/NTAB) family NADH-FMN oxidoreductase RutF
MPFVRASNAIMRGGEEMKKSTTSIARMMPCSVVLLSAGSGKRRDAMTATAMFVSEELPLFVVSVAKSHMTHQLIEESGEFVLNVASSKQVRLAKGLGATHGAKVDKFKKWRVATEAGKSVDAPLIAGSYANIECKVVTSFPAGKYTIFLAQAADFKADANLTPLAWAGNRYFALKDEVR